MSIKTLSVLVVSLAIAAVIAFLTHQFQSRQDAPKVAQAKHEIAFGAKLDAKDNFTMKARSHFEDRGAPIPEDAFSSAKDATGMIAIQTIRKGEILSASQFRAHAGGSVLSSIVSPNMRAITVRVDDVVGVAGFLLPGSQVDVIATSRDQGSVRGVSARTIVENLKVLAVDQQTTADKDSTTKVRAVTLEASPRDAERIVAATQEGKLQLSLRAPLDDLAMPASRTDPQTGEPGIGSAQALDPRSGDEALLSGGTQLEDVSLSESMSLEPGGDVSDQTAREGLGVPPPIDKRVETLRSTTVGCERFEGPSVRELSWRYSEQERCAPVTEEPTVASPRSTDPSVTPRLPSDPSIPPPLKAGQRATQPET